MPIYPLPQFEADLAEQDRETYERLKPPSSIVARFGVMKMVGEFPYDGEQKPGCGSKLVVRTQRGTEIGEMLTSTCPNSGCSKSVTRKEMLQYIENSGGKDYPFFSMQGRALRVATSEDMARQSAIEATKPELTMSARRAVADLKLNMKIVEAEPILGGERLTFYFTSEDRIDFRDLVNRLAAEHKTRIELRQVGARDEARLVADYEKCGQHCCCKQFLKVLKPISMKSAKIQKATLDPLKISGRCGRLMCCLRYEDQTYDDLRKRLPKKKTKVGTPHGPGLVLDTQILTQLALVLLDGSDEQVAVAVEELTFEGAAPGSSVSSALGRGREDDDTDDDDGDGEEHGATRSAEPRSALGLTTPRSESPTSGAAAGAAGTGGAGMGGAGMGGAGGGSSGREPELGVRRAREASGMLPTPVKPAGRPAPFANAPSSPPPVQRGPGATGAQGSGDRRPDGRSGDNRGGDSRAREPRAGDGRAGESRASDQQRSREGRDRDRDRDRGRDRGPRPGPGAATGPGSVADRSGGARPPSSPPRDNRPPRAHERGQGPTGGGARPAPPQQPAGPSMQPGDFNDEGVGDFEGDETSRDSFDRPDSGGPGGQAGLEGQGGGQGGGPGGPGGGPRRRRRRRRGRGGGGGGSAGGGPGGGGGPSGGS